MRMEPRRQADRGLGRRVAEIVGQHSGSEQGGGPGPLLGGPAVVPFEVVPVAMLVADSRASVVAVNSRWCEWAGLDPEDSLGSGWTLALTDEEKTQVTGELRDLAESISEGVGEPSARTVAGPRRRWWFAPFDSAGQVLIGIVVAEEETDLGIAVIPGQGSSPSPGAINDEAPALGGTPGLLDGMDAVIGVLARLARNIRDS